MWASSLELQIDGESSSKCFRRVAKNQAYTAWIDEGCVQSFTSDVQMQVRNQSASSEQHLQT